MDAMQQAKTVAVKACTRCASGLLESDNFCRWCGARQPDRASQPTAVREITFMPATAGPVRAGAYMRVSGPLVSAVVTGALAGATVDSRSGFMRSLTLALISIPVWLMIVLLSPLDAYAAVKNLAR